MNQVWQTFFGNGKLLMHRNNCVDRPGKILQHMIQSRPAEPAARRVARTIYEVGDQLLHLPVRQPLFNLLPAALAFLALSACAPSEYMGISFKPGAAAPELQELARRARAGDKQAQFDLGIRFEEGNGVPRDRRQALKLYKQAAADSGGSQMTYVANNGHVHAVPVSLGKAYPGLAAARKKESCMVLKRERSKADFNGAVAPFSREELWRRIRDLIVNYDGKVTREDVETSFGIELDYAVDEDGSGYTYSLKSENAWYMLIGISNGADNLTNSFFMRWKENAFPESSCDIKLSNDYVKNSLDGTNWLLSRKIDSYGNQADTYKNGRYILNVRMHGLNVVGISFGRNDR